MDIEALAKQYKTNLKKGLTGKKAAEACASTSSFTYFPGLPPRPQTRTCLQPFPAGGFCLPNKEILERDGLNELEKPPKPTLLMLFLMQPLRLHRHECARA